MSPAIAATMHTTLPMAIDATMPAAPTVPQVLSTSAATTSVAIVMPEIGLLELPTSPTMRAETAAKKNPNNAIKTAPRKPTGTAGTAQMNTITQARPISTARKGRSRSVSRAFPSAAEPFPDDVLNVRTKSGMERTSDRNPPIAIAPAPT